MSFSSQKGEFDRFFNRIDRPVKESGLDRLPDRPVKESGLDRLSDRPVDPTGFHHCYRLLSLKVIFYYSENEY